MKEVVTNQGRIRTDAVVNCTGAWANYISGMVGVHTPLGKKRRKPDPLKKGNKEKVDPVSQTANAGPTPPCLIGNYFFLFLVGPVFTLEKIV